MAVHRDRRWPAVGTYVVTIDLLAALELEYEKHRQVSLPQLKSRLNTHLRPFFGGNAKNQNRAEDRALSVTTDRLNAYIPKRQQAGVSDVTINRELEHLQSAFRLAAKSNPPVFPKSEDPLRAPAYRDQEHAAGGYI